MQPFTYNALPARVIFGSGTISKVGEEIQKRGCSKAFIITGSSSASHGEELKTALGPLAAGIFKNAVMHTPTHVTEEALALAKTVGADCLVALGGGSSIGLAKAIALRTNLPQLVIPTTYAGSEVNE
jgi:alcohol dehydrogenase class IV